MKYSTRFFPFGLWLLLSLFSNLQGVAQTHTAKYISMSPDTKGYYEYLPEGYNPSGTTTYPLILFMTGIGEFGNGTPSQLPYVLRNGITKNIEDGTFPKSFTSGGQTFKFIVITPQFLQSPRPTPVDMDTVLRYIIAHYKVDTKRIYITGLSYGGGLTFGYPGSSNTSYAARVAAIVPTASPLPDGGYDTIYARSRRIAAANIPVWATHNSGDTPDSASRTIAYVNDINQTPAPNPLAKMTIFNASGHDSWTKTYDQDFRDKGYDVYEWMLLYKKGGSLPAANTAPTANAGSDKTVTLPTNTVTLAGTGSDAESVVTYSWRKLSGPLEGIITSPTAASTTVTGLTRGVYIFRLTVIDSKSAKATDDIKVTVNSPVGNKAIQVNVYGGSSSYSSSAWNNWNVGSSAGTNITSAAFKYVDGTVSTVTATLSATSAVKDNGSTYGSNLPSVAPTGVLRHRSQYGALRALTLQGLSTTKTYNLEFYASYDSLVTNNSSTIFTVNGTSVTINPYKNLTSKAAFANVAPNASGQIVVNIDRTGAFSYLNGFTLTESTSPRLVQTNVYGGSNAYANSAWNNWNVGTSAVTNVSSGVLNYSDGTASPITTVLSQTGGISDNGSTYGGGMAPAPVLRYASNSTASLRTLTFSGLSTSKNYSLELYASRNYSTAGSTIFTVNGVSQTINAASNLTNKATFINLIPNSSGQLVVNIGRTGSYTSYLNGFTLFEASSNGTTSAATSNGGAPEVVSGTVVRVFPNPVANAVQLQVQNRYSGTVQVQLTDAGGRVLQQWRLTKTGTTLLQTLPTADLPEGAYFIIVQTGSERQTLRIVK